MGTLVGADWGCRVGPDRIAGIIANSGATNFTMAVVNNCIAFRFRAFNVKDIASVRLSWATVTTPGTVQLRIETVDATTGKPTGSLYDSAAAVSITPAVGSQLYTFATLPTAGLTVNSEYAIVLITTGAGTAHTLRGYTAPTNPARYAISALTATDGSTRSSLAELANAVPVCSMVDEDGNENPAGMCPYDQNLTTNCFGNSVTANNVLAALKVTLAVPVVVSGFEVDAFIKIGTPPGDFRFRIFDGSNNVVAGTTVTLDKDSLLVGTGARGCFFLLPAPVTLQPGAYRCAVDSLDSTSSSNCWRVQWARALNAAATPANFSFSTSTNDGSTWTDSAGDIFGGGLIVDSFPVSAGGGLLTHPGMSGGMRG